MYNWFVSMCALFQCRIEADSRKQACAVHRHRLPERQPAEKLLAIAAAKFGGIFRRPLFFDGTARDARQMAEQLGLKIALFQPFRDFEAMPEAQFRRSLDRPGRVRPDGRPGRR
jgi:hypothetical protein